MPLDLPATPGFVDSDFSLETNTQRFTSPLSKATQRVKLGGDSWGVTYLLPKMNRRQAAPWKAFFALCEGSFTSFNAYDPDRKAPLGPATGTPLVQGGAQTGSSLTIDGCTPNVTGWALPSDLFSVNGELKEITAPVDTDGSGQATIYFKPALRNSPADNAPLNFQKPTCTMALVDDMQAKWRCDKNGIYEEKTFAAVEVFN